MLFIQTEGTPRSAGSTAIVLFIQTEDITGCLHRCVGEKKNKNLKVERFHLERGFAQGRLCVELERPECYAPPFIYSSANTPD